MLITVHFHILQSLKNEEYSEKLIAFEKNSKAVSNKLSTTSSGTSLPNYSNFRGRSGSVPASVKRSAKCAHRKLAIRHGAAELSSNIVRFHDDYHIAITSLNKDIKKGRKISEEL